MTQNTIILCLASSKWSNYTSNLKFNKKRTADYSHINCTTKTDSQWRI